MSTQNRQTIVTCHKCKQEATLSDLDATLHRQKWYHLSCWQALVGKI
ncbi:MAG: hypothetical protein ACKOCQ_03770 [Candidatus Nitrosotenuis sp.]